MIDRDKFFPIVREKVFGGSLTQPQVDGINATLDAWEKWAPGSDLRFIGYSLGTEFRETNKTMQPVREAYWLSENWRRTHLRYYPWYGRGKVQLTWEANYEKANRSLHDLGVLTPEESLLKTPDLAMRMDVSSAIMVMGMIEGWFTGKRLKDFFHQSFADWGNARTIINGHDHAAEIAHNSVIFFEALRDSPMAVPLAVPLANIPFRGFVIGDSIALGTARALGWPCDAIEGLGFAEIAKKTVPLGLDVLVVSMGTNPGHKNAAQMDALRPALEKLRFTAKAAGTQRIIWIAPHYLPDLLPQEWKIVASFAREVGDVALVFRATGPGNFHPDSYADVAHQVQAALATTS